MPFVTVTGLAVVLWAGVVELLLARVRLASALRIVLWANVGAALVLAVFSVTLAPLVVLLVGVAVAFDVALFPGSQVVALGRLRPAAA